MGRFGYEGEGEYDFTIGGWIKGSHFQCTEKCSADSITAYLILTGSSAKIKLAIYKDSDESLVGSTEEKELDPFSVAWVKFDFAAPKPVLEADTEYWLVFWSDNANAKGYLDTGAAAGKFGAQEIGYNGWPETYEPGLNAYVASLYCDYTPKPAAYPIAKLNKKVVSGFHCFLNAYLLAKVGGLDPLKLPDGTVF